MIVIVIYNSQRELPIRQLIFVMRIVEHNSNVNYLLGNVSSSVGEAWVSRGLKILVCWILRRAK